MRSTILTMLFLGLCSQQGTLLGILSRPNEQQIAKINHITEFTQELEEFLRCLSTKATIWQKLFGTERWVDLGPAGHKQCCQAISWTYKKNKQKGVHTLRGITRDLILTDKLEVDENGSLELSTEFCQHEKKDQLLYWITSEQIQNDLKKLISWYQPNPDDLHGKEIKALNKLKGALQIFLSVFKKEFKNEPLIERDTINSFLALKLSAKKRNTKQLIALTLAGGAIATCIVIAIRKLRN